LESKVLLFICSSFSHTVPVGPSTVLKCRRLLAGCKTIAYYSDYYFAYTVAGCFNGNDCTDIFGVCNFEYHSQFSTLLL